jgi:hypothetical protein
VCVPTNKIRLITDSLKNFLFGLICSLHNLQIADCRDEATARHSEKKRKETNDRGRKVMRNGYMVQMNGECVDKTEWAIVQSDVVQFFKLDIICVRLFAVYLLTTLDVNISLSLLPIIFFFKYEVTNKKKRY